MSAHRERYLDWLRAHSTPPVEAPHLDTLLTASLLEGSPAQRDLTVDAVSEDGYTALLLATYRCGELASLVVDDDEGHVVVLQAGD